MRIIFGVVFFCAKPENNVRMLMVWDEDEDYYSNWNMLNIRGFCFGCLMIIQWRTIVSEIRVISESIRILDKVIKASVVAVWSSLFLVIINLFAVQDFMYFKTFMDAGKFAKMEYPVLLAKHFRQFIFADFMDEIEHYDWIDYGAFMLFTCLIMIIFTNIVIA